MVQFLSDLRSVLGPSALTRVARKVLENDCLALAGQLAYFFVLFLFPFIMFLVALVSSVVDDPEPALKALAGSLEEFLPGEAIRLLTDYLDRTLQGISSLTLLFAALLTLGTGSAASEAIIKAANRSYGVQETRSFWRIRAISILLILGFTVLIGTLSFVIFSLETEGYLSRLLGLPEVFLGLWKILGWALDFLILTLALDVLYYVAPDAAVPFKWITPGGFMATVLLIVSGEALTFWVANVFRYDQLYGQLGAGIVLLIWLYTTGLMVLIGMEMNAVLTRMAEERKGVELVRTERPEEGGG